MRQRPGQGPPPARFHRWVAAYGVKAMRRGQRVAIHGCMNWLMAQSVRFTPRALVTRVVALMSRPV